MMTKLIQTFVLNVIVAFGVAFIVFLPILGSVLGNQNRPAHGRLFFPPQPSASRTHGEGKSLKLLFIDCGYPHTGNNCMHNYFIALEITSQPSREWKLLYHSSHWQC